MDATLVNRTILRYVQSFSSLSDDECDVLLRCVQERRLGPNQVLFKQGDAGDAMVIVHHGSLSVRARRPDGYDAEVAVIHGGEVLGEMCVIDPAPRSATVVATAPTMVCELSRDALARLRVTAPAVYSAVLGAIIRDIHRRFRDVDARVTELLRVSVASRPPSARASSSPPPPSSPPRPLSSQPAPQPVATPPPEDSAAGAVRRFVDRLRGLA